MCELAGEKDRPRVLSLMRDHLHPDQRIFVGVIDPINPRIETAAEVADRIVGAASVHPAHRLGVTDDCGFSPFGDDTSTSREIALAKIKARIDGVSLASPLPTPESNYHNTTSPGYDGLRRRADPPRRPRDGERKKDVSRPIYLQRDEASCPARVVLRFGGPILGDELMSVGDRPPPP